MLNSQLLLKMQYKFVLCFIPQWGQFETRFHLQASSAYLDIYILHILPKRVEQAGITQVKWMIYLPRAMQTASNIKMPSLFPLI